MSNFDLLKDINIENKNICVVNTTDNLFPNVPNVIFSNDPTSIEDKSLDFVFIYGESSKEQLSGWCTKVCEKGYLGGSNWLFFEKPHTILTLRRTVQMFEVNTPKIYKDYSWLIQAN